MAFANLETPGLPGYQTLPQPLPGSAVPQSGIEALFAALAAHPGGMPNPGLPQQVDPHSPPPVLQQQGSDHRFLGQPSHQSPQAALQTLHHLGGILRQLGHPAFQGHTLPGVPPGVAHQFPSPAARKAWEHSHPHTTLY